MVVNIDKVSQRSRVWRNHRAREQKVKSVITEKTVKFPGSSLEERNRMEQFNPRGLNMKRLHHPSWG